MLSYELKRIWNIFVALQCVKAAGAEPAMPSPEVAPEEVVLRLPPLPAFLIEFRAQREEQAGYWALRDPVPHQPHCGAVWAASPQHRGCMRHPRTGACPPTGCP